MGALLRSLLLLISMSTVCNTLSDNETSPKPQPHDLSKCEEESSPNNNNCTVRSDAPPATTGKRPCEIANFVVNVILLGFEILFGFIANALSILTLWSTRHKSATSVILIWLAVIDIGILVVYGAMTCIPSLCTFYDTCEYYFKFHYPYLRAFLWPFGSIFHMAGTWTIATVTFHRYIAVCHPHLVPKLGSISTAKLQILIIAIGSVLFNIPRFLDDYAYVTSDGSKAVFAFTDLGLSKTYDAIYAVSLYYILIFLLPFSGLIYMTIRLSRDLYAARTKRAQMTRSGRDENDITLTLVSVVVVFLVCQLVSPIRRALRAAIPAADRSVCGSFYPSFTNFAVFMICFNSAVNFVLYCLFGRRFRQTLKKLLCGGNSVGPQDNTTSSLSAPRTGLVNE